MTQIAPAYVLGSPLPGIIRPPSYSSAAAYAAHEFKEICNMACHVAKNHGHGCDFWNGRAGDPIFAMAAGKVVQRYKQNTPGQIGHGSLIIVIKQANGRDNGYAHLASFAANTEVGKSIGRGQIIAKVGNTGTTSPHLHTHDRKGTGDAREIWNLLEQNHGVQFNAGTNGVNIRSAPGLAGALYAVCRTAGIYRKSDNKYLGAHDMVLKARAAAHVYKDGYWWEPKLLGTTPVWMARNFIHFV